MEKFELNRFRGAALAIWVFGAVTPGVVVASRSALTGDSSAITQALAGAYGRAMAGYLGYCPEGYLAFLLPTLTLGPIVILLLALGEPVIERAALRRSTAHSLSVLGAWIVLSAAGLALVFVVIWIRRGEPGLLLGWGARFFGALLISALPAVGLATALCLTLRSRFKALLVGFGVFLVLGLGGVFARTTELASFVPGAIDQALFSGRSDQLALAISNAVIWFGVGILFATLVRTRFSRSPLPSG